MEMKLQKFVAEAISEIIFGVQEAKDKTRQTSAKVNPELVGDAKDFSQTGILRTSSGESATVVEFDLAVTITEGTGTSGNIGVVAGFFKLGSHGQSKNENISLSRIRFKIPLTLP
jgi:hypothetical protein